jgi:DNA invertase Pin-like site-specific DNA recombinase
MLKERGIDFRSLQEQIDTSTSGGKLVFHFFGALAEFSVISTRRGAEVPALGVAV